MNHISAVRNQAPQGTKYCQGCTDRGEDPHRAHSEFAKRGKGLQSLCKRCFNELNRERYKANQQYYIDKANRRRKGLAKWYREFKRQLKCSLCGEDHPACIQFHHKDPSQKEIILSSAIAHCWSKNRIMREIAKCEIVCANCHFKIHWDEIPSAPQADALIH